MYSAPFYHMTQDALSMQITFPPNDKANPAGKLANVEFCFAGGPLDGMKLVGSAIWRRQDGSRNVTFPARQYLVNGGRRSFSLLRPITDGQSTERLRQVIVDAYEVHEKNATSTLGSALDQAVSPISANK